MGDIYGLPRGSAGWDRDDDIDYEPADYQDDNEDVEECESCGGVGCDQCDGTGEIDFSEPFGDN